MAETFKFEAKLWEWKGKAAWHFVTVPKGINDDINFRYSDAKRGFGSLPVVVKVKDFEWETSIFPDSKVGSYILPVKAEVRNKFGIQTDDNIEISLRIKGK